MSLPFAPTGTPVVSVVIVNFNSGGWLSRCVESVLASTLAVEVLVSDNGSRDRSMAELERRFGRDPRLKALYNRANLGFARGANRALDRTSGPFLLLLNPDCIIQPDTLERMVAAMQSYPQAGMAGCLIRNEDGTEQRGCRRRIPTAWSSLARGLGSDAGGGRGFDLAGSPLPGAPMPVEAISGAFMLVRREAVDKVGLLDEGFFLHCEDLDWCLRFTRACYSVIFVPGVEIVHKQGVCGEAAPIRVEWFKHRGMAHFYRKHHRGALARLLFVPVHAAIFLRFAIKALVLALGRAGRQAPNPPHSPPSHG